MKKFFEELSRRLREGGVESSNVEDTAGSMAAPSQRTAGVMAILRKQKITVSVYAVLPFPASIRGTSIAMIFASRRCTDRNTLWWVG